MSETVEPRIPFWAKGVFFVGDALLLLVAFLVVLESPKPMPWNHLLLLAGCVAVGAILSMVPFILEYKAAVRLTEMEGLRSSLEQIRQVEAIGDQIQMATGQWQTVQEHCNRAVATSKEITDQMVKEGQAFSEFMRKAQDTEKAHLRLEVEKLRRAENDWLEVVVRICDHVFALQRAALQSGQANVIHQIGMFQKAVHDVAHRIGLVPHVASAGEPFQETHHQLADPGQQALAQAGALVAETVASGYTMQGQRIRRAVVLVQAPAGAEALATEALTAPAPGAGSQLSLMDSGAASDEAATPSGAS